MKKHTKIYMAALGYDETDFMPCEITGCKGVDIHHIVNRDNRIENLMLLTREKHVELGEIKSKMAQLLINHRLFLQNNGVKFNNNWFEEQLDKYIWHAN
tara:strand:- start:782 stop:1078 length:297 start_codon:yes stop_codon:yes gene_type:complete